MKALVIEAQWEPRENYYVTDIECETGKALNGNNIWKYPKFILKEVGEPLSGPEQVLIKVQSCAISENQLKLYKSDKKNYIKYKGMTRFPLIPGHEFSGIVVQTGKNVTNVSPGDMVISEDTFYCESCINCRSTKKNYCENLEKIGFTINGGMAEYISLDEKYCWNINSFKDIYKGEDIFSAGTTVFSYVMAYKALYGGKNIFRPGEDLAVFGCNPIGLAIINLAKISGAVRIIGIDKDENNLDLASKLGANLTLNINLLKEEGQILHYRLLKEFKKGITYQFNTTDDKSLITEMIEASAFKGNIIQIGSIEDTLTIPVEAIKLRDIKIKIPELTMNGYEINNIIKLISSGIIKVDEIIKEKYELSKITDLINNLNDDMTNLIVINN